MDKNEKYAPLKYGRGVALVKHHPSTCENFQMGIWKVYFHGHLDLYQYDYTFNTRHENSRRLHFTIFQACGLWMVMGNGPS